MISLRSEIVICFHKALDFVEKLRRMSLLFLVMGFDRVILMHRGDSSSMCEVLDSTLANFLALWKMMNILVMIIYVVCYVEEDREGGGSRRRRGRGRRGKSTEEEKEAEE